MGKIRMSWLALLALWAPAGAAFDLAEVEQRGVLRVIVWTGNLPALYERQGPLRPGP